MRRIIGSRSDFSAWAKSRSGITGTVIFCFLPWWVVSRVVIGVKISNPCDSSILYAGSLALGRFRSLRGYQGMGGDFFWGPLAERAGRGTKAGASRVSRRGGETGMIRGGGKFEMEE